MDRATRRYVPAAGFALLLLAVSLRPAPETGGPTPQLVGIAVDKWVHVGSYGLLTVLLAWGLHTRTLSVVAAVALVAVCYGGGIELLQGLVPSRSPSVADMVANTVGAVAGGSVWLATRATPSMRERWRSEQ